MMYIRKLITVANYLCLTICHSKVLKKFVSGGGGTTPPKTYEGLKPVSTKYRPVCKIHTFQMAEKIAIDSSLAYKYLTIYKF